MNDEAWAIIKPDGTMMVEHLRRSRHMATAFASVLAGHRNDWIAAEREGWRVVSVTITPLPSPSR